VESAKSTRVTSGQAPLHWVAMLHLRDLASANFLRHLPGAQIAEHRDEIWLRGAMEDGRPPVALSRLPLREIYWWVEDRALAPLDSKVPVRKFPAGLVWKSLSESFQPQVETRSLPAELELDLPRIRLIRGGPMTEPNLVKLPFASLAKWAIAAAEIRLQPLTFACSEDGEALVRGLPLPPVQGARYFEADGVAAPAGWQWDPPIPAKALAGALQLWPNDLALLDAEGTIERIPASHFVPLTRAAIRLSPTDLPDMEATSEGSNEEDNA